MSSTVGGINDPIILKVICTVYHVTAVLAIITTLTCFFFYCKRFQKSTEHTTSKILVAYYILTSTARSLCALIITVSVLYFEINPSTSNIILLRRLVMILIIQQRFIPFLIMADWKLRVKKVANYGNGKKSLLFLFFNIAVVSFICLVIAVVPFIFKVNAPLYFNINIFITVSSAVIMSKLLYEKAKNLRKLSVLSSSLSERHTFSKMVSFFKRFFPIILIDTFCGIICVSVSFASIHLVNFEPFISFCFSFMWIETSIIASTIYATKPLYLMSLKLFEQRIGQKRRIGSIGKVKSKTVIVETMAGQVPGGQTIDEYFVAFNSWIK